MRTKIIAMYLPQYHSIPENDEFWGKGFTDWVTVRKAQSLFEGHQQPRVPLNNNYYDLSEEENVVWQANLAKQYGIYGFGVYHYWFNNEKNLLTKPAEIIRDSNDVNIYYLLSWDNLSWRRTWSNLGGNAWAPTLEGKERKGPATLIEYILGDEEDWKKHYLYVKSHFESDKYIKIDGKPVFIIFYYSNDIAKMCDYWNKLAQDDGYPGVFFIFKREEHGFFFRTPKTPGKVVAFNYEPMFNGWQNNSFLIRVQNRICRYLGKRNEHLKILDYDKIWKKLLNTAKGRCKNEYTFHGAFVSYDDTPRRGEKRGIIISGSTPDKFRGYMTQLMDICENQNKPFLFLTAWNEWGEGAYLEPDTINEYSYLEAIREITK